VRLRSGSLDDDRSPCWSAEEATRASSSKTRLVKESAPAARSRSRLRTWSATRASLRPRPVSRSSLLPSNASAPAGQLASRYGGNEGRGGRETEWRGPLRTIPLFRNYARPFRALRRGRMTCPADDRCIRSREARDSGNASNHVAVGGCLCRFSDTAPLSLSLSLPRRSRSLVIDSRKEWNVLIARARRKTELISSRDLIWKSLPGVILSLARLVARACNR